ncbi:MAG: hypothetical protein QW435_04310 [Candidatus Hadarchaeales archaeon]
MEKVRGVDPKSRLTWIDSLSVAAGALAREKAGMTLSKIADELARGEQTIRLHLTGKTEAGKLVRETYEMLLRGEKLSFFFWTESKEEGLKLELEKERREKIELQEKLNRLQERLEQIMRTLEEVLRQLKNLS